MRWFFALLLLTGIAFGQSQPEPQPNKQPQSTKQPTAADQRGTEQSPAFVKIIPTPKTAAEANQEAKERDEKAQTDLWIIRWTGAVALFTLVLAGVGVWQGIQLKRSVDLARDEFNATHRPWVPIIDWKIGSDLMWVQGNAIIILKITCKNTGDSPAQRASMRAEVFPFLANDDIPIKIENLKSKPRAKESEALMERTLFPGMPRDLILSQGVMLTKTAISELKDFYGEPAKEMIPVIVGFIEYYFPFGESIAHYTPFAYHVWRTDPNNTDARFSFQLDGRNVSANEILLVDLINAGDPS